MINYIGASSENDLLGILALQRDNLPSSLTEKEITSQGFVTVRHDFKDLQKMNLLEASVIARDGEKVIAYLLAMTEASRADIPTLAPLFETFDRIHYEGKPISGYRYIVVGQACVARDYRGQGVFDACYRAYKSFFEKKYQFAVTEISTKNLRSVRAHTRIGFREVHRYMAPEQGEWSVVLWDWKSPDANEFIDINSPPVIL